MIIPVKTQTGGYDIILEKGAISEAGRHFDLNRRVLVVTDDGVPAQYARTVARGCREAVVYTLPQGEGSKCEKQLFALLHVMTEKEFDRRDCVVAVGGGVVGDISGLAASLYMRGIDFYNIPTTLLSQVDSSIGGKTAIDFDGYKNIIGAFYPPRAVIIDSSTLETLAPRQFACGMAEAVKMAATCDRELFEMIENGADTDTVIYRSLLIKKRVVEQDERENGLRRVLNFGHTLAHAVEAKTGLYHGECVAIGMIPMCSDAAAKRLVPLLKRLGLPTKSGCSASELAELMAHDKKKSGDKITVIYCDEIGSFEMRSVTLEQLEAMI